MLPLPSKVRFVIDQNLCQIRSQKRLLGTDFSNRKLRLELSETLPLKNGKKELSFRTQNVR